MNILVTGSNGQLGTAIKRAVEIMGGNGHPDHDTSEKNYYIFATHGDLDITKAEKVLDFVKENHICVIVNCAAYTNVNGAQDHIDEAYAVNAVGPMNLAIAAKAVGAVLIHISTDYVFGGMYNEPLRPISQKDAEAFVPVRRDDNFYGYSKLVGEDLIEHSGCKYLIFRTSWLYSEYGKNFLTTMYENSSTATRVKVVFDQVGSPTNATDLADFIMHIIQDNTHETRYLSKCGIYNFANIGVASWFDVAHEIFNKVKKNEHLITPCHSDEFPSPVVRPSYSVLDVTETEKEFDYYPRYWRVAIQDSINALKEKTKLKYEAMEAENTEYSYGHNVELRYGGGDE